MREQVTPLWEVFIRARTGLAHKHVGSVHAADATLALQAARDVYTRRGEGLSIWVVPSNAITASDPADKDMLLRSTKCLTKSTICSAVLSASMLRATEPANRDETR
jgi:ring-1,2-phenylacetyl-CoA epoxidase subunit PaaB